MGGPGSNRWKRGDRKALLTTCIRISVKPAKKSPSKFEIQALVPHDLRYRELAIQIWHNQLTVEYHKFETILEPLSHHQLSIINQRVELIRAANNYRGQTYLFTCRVCEQASRSLYLPGTSNIAACRKCHELAYPSSRKSRKLPGQIQEFFAHFWNDEYKAAL